MNNNYILSKDNFPSHNPDHISVQPHLPVPPPLPPEIGVTELLVGHWRSLPLWGGGTPRGTSERRTLGTKHERNGKGIFCQFMNLQGLMQCGRC